MRFVRALVCSIFIGLLAALLMADHSAATSECESDCAFRFDIDFQWGGAPILPKDTIRRQGYLKCMEKCGNESQDGSDD